MVKGLRDFMGENFSKYITTLPTLVAIDLFVVEIYHRHCGSRDIADLNFHLILQDLLIKGYSDFMEGSSSRYIPTLPRLVAVDIVEVDI